MTSIQRVPLFVFLVFIFFLFLGCGHKQVLKASSPKSITVLRGGHGVIGTATFNMTDLTMHEIVISPKWVRQPQDELRVYESQIPATIGLSLRQAATEIRRSGGVVFCGNPMEDCFVTLEYEGGEARDIVFFFGRPFASFLYRSRPEERELGKLLFEIEGHAKRSETKLTPEDDRFRPLAAEYERTISRAETRFEALFSRHHGWRSFISGQKEWEHYFRTNMTGTREYIHAIVAQPQSGSKDNAAP